MGLLRDTVRSVGNTLVRLASPAETALIKAGNGERSLLPKVSGSEEAKGLYYDPFMLLEMMGWKERPSSISYDTLQSLAYMCPVYTAIMQTRINQVRQFARPQQDPREAGFMIRTRTKEKQPTKSDKRVMREFEEWILNMGSTKDPQKILLEDALCMLTRDSLIYDQASLEVVPNRKGQPCDVYVLDGATVRHADVPDHPRPGTPVFVQVYNGMVVADFTAKELCFGVRNPRADIRVHNYGLSELEMGAQVITAMLYAFTYNQKFFQQGSVPKGIINLPGLTDSKLRAFQRQWRQVVSGVANAFRTPILNAQELQYVSMQVTNRDMEFSSWMDWQIRIFSAICQFDPAEINFLYGQQGQSSSLFQAPAEQRVKESKDRGLKPLLNSIAGWFNRYVIWPITDEYELYFTGVNPRDSERRLDMSQKEGKVYKTINEIRAEYDMPPIAEVPENPGDYIMDPAYYQIVQQMQMAQQQAQMGGGGAEMPPGQEGGQPGEQAPPEDAGWPEDQGWPDEEPTQKSARVTSQYVPNGGGKRRYMLEF